MRTPKRFNLLFVHGDGARILRLSIPRWVLYGGLLVLLLGASALAAISTDYLALQQRWSRVAAVQERAAEQKALLEERVAEQQALLEAFRRRIADVRDEVVSWRDLHARIWEPFGPGLNAERAEAGVGGSDNPGGPDIPAPGAGLAEDLDFLVASVNEAGQSLRTLERLVSKAGKVLATLPSRWPVRGSVKSSFGWRRSPWTSAREFHNGLDISAKRGTPIKAPAPGRVTFAGRRGDYGLTVILSHANAIKTVYAHLKRLKVRTGQQVKRGQTIGLSGNSGRSTGPHLHYEIVVKGRAVNPRAYLWD
ncbi:MAG: M23 family metallopeptidase [Candidatus Methylomirabilia bacterium]